MVVLAILAALLAALIGLGLKYLLHKRDSTSPSGTPRRITWPEFAVVVILMSALVAPVVTIVGDSLSRTAALTDIEYWNSTQRHAGFNVTTCEEGQSGQSESAGQSNCAYQYDTGQSYTWSTQDCYTVGSGSNKQRVCDTIWHSADIFAPFANQELHYYVTDWLGGRYEYPKAYVASNPVPFDPGHAVPTGIPHGPPATWVSAHVHELAHNQLPVTHQETYSNPIMASHDQDYLTWSNQIGYYLSKGLLPLHTQNLFNHPVSDGPQPSANKVTFVHVPVANQAAWESGNAWLNAALGMKLQGDLHVVVINSALVSSPEQYTRALVAYWQSQKYFDKNVISKNGVILVIGTADGRTIDWAQARTGMPFGNGPMLTAMSTFLQGQPLSPTLIFGHPITRISETKSGHQNVTVTLSRPAGILSQVMLAQFPFKRACMFCKGEDGVGYAYLVQRIQPPLHDKIYILLVVELAALGLWTLVGFTDIQGAVTSVRSVNGSSSRRRSTTRTWR